MGVSAELDDALGPMLGDRLESELRSALRRRPSHEGRLGGALQLLAPYSSRLREAMLAALNVLVHRSAYSRPLFLPILRGLVACHEDRLAPLLTKALCVEDGLDLGTVAAAAMFPHPEIAQPLAKLALSRSPHLSFAGELARTARGESVGQGLSDSALRMKESHRLQIVSSLILPLVREKQGCRGAGEGIRVLRESERHLGRWLLFAELGQLSGDTTPLQSAQTQATHGPMSARTAWALVAWSLQGSLQSANVRPTLEVVARLSDRPSAERDLTFLFRMAQMQEPTTRPMLEALAKEPQATSENAVRAAGYLLMQADRQDLQRRLLELVRSTKREELRGLALAALHAARPAAVADQAFDFTRNRQLQNAVFAALVRLAQRGHASNNLLSEAIYRRGQLGWLD